MRSPIELLLHVHDNRLLLTVKIISNHIYLKSAWKESSVLTFPRRFFFFFLCLRIQREAIVAMWHAFFMLDNKKSILLLKKRCFWFGSDTFYYKPSKCGPHYAGKDSTPILCEKKNRVCTCASSSKYHNHNLLVIKWTFTWPQIGLNLEPKRFSKKYQACSIMDNNLVEKFPLSATQCWRVKLSRVRVVDSLCDVGIPFLNSIKFKIDYTWNAIKRINTLPMLRSRLVPGQWIPWRR